ncbi:unnamed protein product [Notodromas monacha]|uniref:UDP-glucuronosyltransferase n=1 Tax=Notodromas monacha TaxID=399045 RepID=A0A7R9BJ19_9CRUS|nr:unnamed protein product [Notodromas monacha]CAG0916120.1 unnamed protein product [Notodromas monacha]
MERLAFLVAFSLVAITAPGAFCAKILFAYPIAVTSHTQVYEPIIEALGQRGHNVTVYAGLAPRREMPPNVNLHISKQLENVLSGDSGPLNNSFQTLRTPLNFKMIFNSFDWPRQWCEEIMQDPVYHNLWNASNDTVFDLVIVSSAFNECVYGLIWRDKLPFVLVSPTGMFPWVGYAIGNPSYVVAAPTLFLSSSSNRMNFMERLSNWAISVIYGAIYYWNSAPKTSNVLRQYFPEFPHPNEVTKNASLYLLNTDISMDYPRPLLPSVKEIGGLHCRSAQPLPEDLESFVTKPGSSGLILFSLGSTVKGVHMPPQFRAVFTEVFRRLPEYQVMVLISRG